MSSGRSWANARRGPVPTVADDQVDLGHELAWSTHRLQRDVARRGQRGRVDGRAGGEHNVTRRAPSASSKRWATVSMPDNQTVLRVTSSNGRPEG
jgi:hypothetical protein